MAGLFGNYAPQDSGGLLSKAQGYSTGDKIGLIGSVLQDAYAGYWGKPGGNAERAIAQVDNRNIQSRLISDLQSPDPQTRQRAYMFARLNGVDTKPFEQQQATQQLPQLLQSMRPSQQTLNGTSAPLPGGGNVNAAPINFEAPGLNISDAIGQAPPELQGQYAPKLLEQQMTAEADANKPFELSAGQHRFVGGQDVASLPEKPTPNAPFNLDGTANKAFQDYQVMLRRAGAAGSNNGGNVQSVQPLNDGTLLVVRRDGSTAHVAADGQNVTGARFDPTTHFNMGAAGAAGKAAGTAAEAFPTVAANFGIINDTLKSFDDPNIKSQANHALGWQGKATFGTSIPGVTSDFNAHLGQLEGQTFLQAFNTLRGGGQITEIEGGKATAAIARLQKAQTPDEFYTALGDAKKTFGTLYESAKQRASRGAVVPALRTNAAPLPTLPPPQASQPPPPQKASGGWTVKRRNP